MTQLCALQQLGVHTSCVVSVLPTHTQQLHGEPKRQTAPSPMPKE